MGFKIPNHLKQYLESTKYRKPFENFINNSTYYSQLNWQWMSYMQNVVRPCMAYATAGVDGVYNSSLSMSTGMAICKGATRLICGDKLFFIGEDESTRFLSDVWTPAVNFQRTLARATSFMVEGGTSVLKINTDEHGKNTLHAFRIDRTLLSTDEQGDVTNAVFFISLLSSMKQGGEESTYWLVEERKYNDEGQKVIIYKVFQKNSTANSPTLPSPYQCGISVTNLPPRVLRELRRMRVPALNTEVSLPYDDGLGVWLLQRTATNSCVPDAPFGDPLLYGCLDLLWSIDLVFSGTIIDVLNGEGKIIVPKQFLQDTLNRMAKQYPGATFNVTDIEVDGYKDESFVYVMPSGIDKDKIAPTPVQFDIRADQYGKMMEIYERAACVRAGFSPTSIFPYLTPDNSAKTATEVTAEENLTTASVRDIHNLMCPVLNRALREVLKREGFSVDCQIQLGDYVGNKIQRDANIISKYEAGLMPKEAAVKQINNLTDRETAEYIEKIEADESKRAERESSFPGMEIPPGLTELGGGTNAGSNGSFESAGFGA